MKTGACYVKYDYFWLGTDIALRGATGEPEQDLNRPLYSVKLPHDTAKKFGDDDKWARGIAKATSTRYESSIATATPWDSVEKAPELPPGTICAKKSRAQSRKKAP
ncbi:hypothetical protein FRB98_003517 [Tulasnella sp. 332]|nr:hypothetical protein FRB98_003517 [Tulasnella sp. 332]